MSVTNVGDIAEQKRQIREQAHANRKDQPEKDELSRQICATFMALPEYKAANTARCLSRSPS